METAITHCPPLADTQGRKSEIWCHFGFRCIRPQTIDIKVPILVWVSKILVLIQLYLTKNEEWAKRIQMRGQKGTVALRDKAQVWPGPEGVCSEEMLGTRLESFDMWNL